MTLGWAVISFSLIGKQNNSRNSVNSVLLGEKGNPVPPSPKLLSVFPTLLYNNRFPKIPLQGGKGGFSLVFFSGVQGEGEVESWLVRSRPASPPSSSPRTTTSTLPLVCVKGTKFSPSFFFLCPEHLCLLFNIMSLKQQRVLRTRLQQVVYLGRLVSLILGDVSVLHQKSLRRRCSNWHPQGKKTTTFSREITWTTISHTSWRNCASPQFLLFVFRRITFCVSVKGTIVEPSRSVITSTKLVSTYRHLLFSSHLTIHFLRIPNSLKRNSSCLCSKEQEHDNTSYSFLCCHTSPRLERNWAPYHLDTADWPWHLCQRLYRCQVPPSIDNISPISCWKWFFKKHEGRQQFQRIWSNVQFGSMPLMYQR